jgi:TIR domain
MDSTGVNQRIFISYARADIDRVYPLYEVLKTYNFELWFDRDNLVPGQNWQNEIARSIRKARVFLLFISSTWVKSRSYVQKELKLALDVFQEMPSDEAFIVPVRLDNCTVPDELSKLHWMDLWDNTEITKLAAILMKIIDGDDSDFFVRTPIVMGSPVVKRASEAILGLFYREVIMALASDKINQTLYDDREHSTMAIYSFDGAQIVAVVHVHLGTPSEFAPTVRGQFSQRLSLAGSADGVMMLDYFIERLQPQDMQPSRIHLFVTFVALRPEALPDLARVILIHPEIMTQAEMDQLH